MIIENNFLFKKDNRNYLNTCGLGVAPYEVVKDLGNNYLMLSSNPHIEFEFEKDIETYRKRIRELINQKDENMSFLRNVTEGLIIAAQSIPFVKQEEIILTNMDHRAAMNCWYLRQIHNPELELKIRIADINVKDDSEQIIEKIFALVNEKTRVICVPHVDRYFGLLFPVEEISKRAKRMGVVTVIDGAQTMGLINVDLSSIDCDIYLSCLHKWYLSPLSIGTISVNPRIFHKLIRSYATSSRWNEEKIENRQFGGKELGTRNVAVEKSLGSLIEFHSKWDRFIYDSDYSGKQKLINELKNIDGVEVAQPIDNLGKYGIVTFRVRGLNSKEIIETLEKKYRISVGLTSRDIGDYVRVSLFFYNSEDDIDDLIAALKEIIHLKI